MIMTRIAVSPHQKNGNPNQILEMVSLTSGHLVVEDDASSPTFLPPKPFNQSHSM